MSDRIDNIVWYHLLEAKKWSGKVKTKFHPAEGTFTSADPQKIASEITKDSPSLQTAMSRLNFFLNRAGKNASPETRAAVEKAKDIVHAKYGSKE